MITKFKTIKNLAVFQNYNWDTSINNEYFKEINVIYGRNYSGKTTLSRIIRALEKGEISDKYDNPEFEVSIKDMLDATQVNLTGHGKKIRVFNEDFVKANLKFIVNSDESINPFAILGGNTTLEAEIANLNSELGVVTEGSETGFYLELKNAKHIELIAKQAYETANNALNQQLSFKAINNPHGIKYKSERYGDQNYTKPKLESDIATVAESTFTPLSDSEVTQKLALLNERVNQDISSISKVRLTLKAMSDKAEGLITKPISNSDKIEQLVKDSILNRWVKEGKQLHKDKLELCSFCGNDISDERWKELDSHFDEESEKLEKEIDLAIVEIYTSLSTLDNSLEINKSLFYSKFHNDLDRLIALRQQIITSIKSELTHVKNQLQNRKDDLLNVKSYVPIKDNSKRLEWCWTIFENLRVAANSYSVSIGSEQTNAKRSLRLREVSDFVRTIQYSTEIANIQRLKNSR